MISQTLDSTFIEHDAYILFEKIMKHAKPWYEFNERIVTKGNRNVSFFNLYIYESNSNGVHNNCNYILY